VAVGGSHHETIDIAVDALAPFSGPAQAAILGRHERFDVMNAAFINGVSSHIFDYDDTHLKTIIHPAGPVVSAILGLAESASAPPWRDRFQPVDGRAFLNALVLGVETECRIGNAVYPDHYDRGWHITGTAGVFGAAVSAGKLLGLSEQQMIWAIGLAASQPVGLRESFGSMNKSFNPGRAASNGLFAAFLASKTITTPDQMIEAKRGWANTISTKQDYNEITEGLGERYEALLNTYKPFACGIVMHPAIDAAIQLRNQYQIKPDQIDTINLKVNPLVLELTGKKTPTSGLEGKFSIYHAVAVAIVEGAAGEKQFSDRAVQDPTIVALRTRVVPAVDPTVKPEQVEMSLTLKDGRQLEKTIQHAIGSLEAPMTDHDLETKFTDLADGILKPEQIRKLIGLCWDVEKLSNAGDIAKAAVPA
jgi:2-methylcitrate dehydratase PrpD